MTGDPRICPECQSFFPHGNRRSPSTRARHDMRILAGLTILGFGVFAVIALAVFALAIFGGWGPGW